MTPRFVVIEDDTDARVLVGAIINSLGCEAVLLDCGEQAIKYFESLENAAGVDAVLLDLMMPGINGYEVLQFLKENLYTKDIPVILLTCKGKGEEIVTGYQNGADYYIPKPFTREQLVFGLNLFLNPEEEQDELEPKDDFPAA